GMYLESAHLESTFDAFQDLPCLLFRPAVRHNIVRVSLERHGRMSLLHPVVEREVQEDIGQKGTRNSALGRPLRSRYQRSIFQLYGGFEPPLHIEQDPRALRILSNRAHRERVVEIVKEGSDVQVD